MRSTKGGSPTAIP